VAANERSVAGSKVKERAHYERGSQGSCTHGHGVGVVKTEFEGGFSSEKTKACWCPEFVAVSPDALRKSIALLTCSGCGRMIAASLTRKRKTCVGGGA